MKGYYKEIWKVLECLARRFPKKSLGEVISDALKFSNFNCITDVDDKTFLMLLKEYKKETKIVLPSQEELNKIIEEGKHINRVIFDESLDVYGETELY